ncbi:MULTISPECIES: M16 family metallopeptidase [Butyricimonas]|uniref:M16 family metallopeptidase n=1 Tax=Butyricimonas TaxID=574697 RepID=UPI0022DEA20A|nr:MULTISPECIES: M16 family metallopeptidase [Butyricimonas]
MKNILLLIIISIQIPRLLHAQDSPSIFRHGKLENGLTYYVRHTNLQPGKADFYLVQNVGALMEDDNQNGLAHFLEHMAFNGSESFKEGIPNFLKRHGVTQFNAHTGQDETVYYMTNVPTNNKELVDSCIIVMKDWSGFLLLKPDEIDKERGVIQEERRMRRNLGTRLKEQTDAHVYNHSKYATHDIIGSEEILKNFTPEELRAYYNDFYRPDLQAVIVVGDVDAAKIEAEIQRLFNPIPKRVNPKPRLVYEIQDNAFPLYAKAFDKEMTEASMTLLKRVKQNPPASLKEMMKQNLINRFYNQIMEKYLRKYVETQNPSFLETMVGFGGLVRNYDRWNIYIQAYPHKERQALKELMEEIERIHQYAINDKEVKEQVNAYLSGLDETEKNKDKFPNEVYVQMYQNNFLEGKPLTSIEEDIALSREILSGLTTKDVQDWIASWNSDSKNWVFIMQGNDPDYDFPTQEEILNIIQEARHKKLSSHAEEVKAVPLIDFEIKSGSIVKTKKIKMLDAEEWTLSNGCKVYYKFSDQDGMKVSLLGESAGGQSLLPVEDLPSATALSTLIMYSGLYKHNTEMMQAILKGHHIMPNITLGETFEGVSGVCDNNETEMLFQIIYLFFEHPRFDRNDFDKYVYMNKLQVENTPRTVNDTISEQMQQLRVKESPRLWKADSKFYDAMNYDKMVAIYKDRFQDASDFTFYLTGNIQREEAQALVAKYLGAIPSTYRKEKAVHYDLQKKGSITETIVANIPDNKYMTNIEYRNSLKLKPVENLAIDVIRFALSNRYHEIIREDEGGAYGVNVGAAYENAPKPAQMISVNFQSNTEKGDQMRAIVHEQIDKLIAEGVSEDDVNDMILMMKKGRAGVLENRGNAHWQEALRYYVQTGKDLDSPDLFEKPLEKLNPKIVQEVARKFFATAECIDIVVRSK